MNFFWPIHSGSEWPTFVWGSYFVGSCVGSLFVLHFLCGFLFLPRALTHSLAHSLASSLAHSLPRSLARSLARSLTHLLTHSVTLSLSHTLTLTRPLARPPARSIYWQAQYFLHLGVCLRGRGNIRQLSKGTGCCRARGLGAQSA